MVREMVIKMLAGIVEENNVYSPEAQALLEELSKKELPPCPPPPDDPGVNVSGV